MEQRGDLTAEDHLEVETLEPEETVRDIVSVNIQTTEWEPK